MLKAPPDGRLPVNVGAVRYLEERDSARSQDPAHLPHVSERDPRIRNVLEHHERVTDIRALRLDRRQALAVADDPFDVVEPRIELPGTVEHLRGDIERSDLTTALGEEAGDPPDTAADLDDRIPRRDPDVQELEHLVKRLAPVRPEPLEVGLPVAKPVVDEVEGVLPGARVPEPLPEPL